MNRFLVSTSALLIAILTATTLLLPTSSTVINDKSSNHAHFQSIGAITKTKINNSRHTLETLYNTKKTVWLNDDLPKSLHIKTNTITPIQIQYGKIDSNVRAALLYVY